MLQNYPTDRTRERNQIPRGGKNCIKTLRPTFHHLRYDPEKIFRVDPKKGLKDRGKGGVIHG